MSGLHRHLAWASGAAALTILLFAPARTLEIEAVERFLSEKGTIAPPH